MDKDDGNSMKSSSTSILPTLVSSQVTKRMTGSTAA
jgi:hypothetical protein